MAEEIDVENGRNSNFEGLVTLTLTAQTLSGRTAYRRASVIDLYLYTEFHGDGKEKNFESQH